MPSKPLQQNGKNALVSSFCPVLVAAGFDALGFHVFAVKHHHGLLNGPSRQRA